MVITMSKMMENTGKGVDLALDFKSLDARIMILGWPAKHFKLKLSMHVIYTIHVYLGLFKPLQNSS